MTRTFPKFTLPDRKPKYQKFIAIPIILLIVVVVGFFGWKYWQAQKTIAELKNKEQAAKQEVAAVTKAVGALIILPEGTPTVATVTDKTKLAKNDFFKRAENGDKVLIYSDARRAYLYRPGTKQLVDVTPLNLQQNATESAQAQTQAPPSSKIVATDITLSNGTTTTGLTNQYEQKIKKSFPGITIPKKQNAAASNYTKSVIVDVKGDQPGLAKLIGDELGLTVEKLPAGEATPTTPFMIILGSDAL